MRYFLLTILAILGTVTFGESQNLLKDQLLKDSNITWLLETEYVYPFEQTRNITADLSDGRYMYTIKNDVRAVCQSPSHRLLTNLLLAESGNPQWTYTDKDNKSITTQQVTDMIATYDTIVTFDEVTYQETMKVVKFMANPDKITGVQVRQLWYFHEQRQLIESAVIAIAPVFNMVDETGAVVGTEPLYWIQVEGKLPKQLYDASVPWIKETGTYTDFSEGQLLKGNTEETLDYALWQKPKMNLVPLYDDNVMQCDRKQLKDDDLIGVFIGGLDTLITFDPDTYKETVMVVQNEALSPKDIEEYKVIQTWYYDKNCQCLSVKVQAIAPVVLLSQNGELRRRSLFFIRMEGGE